MPSKSVSPRSCCGTGTGTSGRGEALLSMLTMPVSVMTAGRGRSWALRLGGSAVERRVVVAVEQIAQPRRGLASASAAGGALDLGQQFGDQAARQRLVLLMRRNWSRWTSTVSATNAVTGTGRSCASLGKASARCWPSTIHAGLGRRSRAVGSRACRWPRVRR